MPKIVLDDVQGGTDLSKINENFQKIEDELNNKVLYRVNPPGEPNAMSGNLDMNGQFVLNSANGGGGGGGGSNEAVDIHFVPGSGIAADNVQDAIEELAADLPQAAINVPQPVGLIASLGTSPRYAREDHVHVGDGGGGGGGGSAISNGQVYAYQRAVSPPVGTPGDVTYTFATASITTPAGNSLANGWTKTIPAGTNPLYVTVASASSTGTSDIIASNEWSSPVVLTENGTNGTNGLNVATVYIYKRAATNAPQTLPSISTTYQFNPPLLTGLNNGWTTTVPDSSGGPYLFVSTATAVSNTSTDTITAGEWATAQVLAQDGSNGNIGPQGADGTRGTVNIAAGGFTSWSDSAANAAIASAGYGSPINRDVVTLYGTGFSQTRYRQSGSWLVLSAYINGNLLVSGTVSGNTISGGTMTSTIVRYGTGFTPSGNAFEVTGAGSVWADNLFGGIAFMDNSHYASQASILSSTSNNSAKAAVEAVVSGTNSNAGAAGLYARSAFNGTGGLVGPNLAFDFYANGSGTNYGPFTGAHDALVIPTESFAIGDIVVDKKCVSRSNVSNTIFEVTKSTEPNQKASVGVIAVPPKAIDWLPSGFVGGYEEDWKQIPNAQYEDAKETYHITAINALGEGQINVCGEGGDIEAGDFITTSSMPGKGMKQSDDVQRNYTVAKAREACTFTNPGETKMIACIYLCG